MNSFAQSDIRNVICLLSTSFALGCVGHHQSSLLSAQFSGESGYGDRPQARLVRESVNLGPQPAIAPVFSASSTSLEGHQGVFRTRGPREPIGVIFHPAVHVEIAYPEGHRPTFFSVELSQNYAEGVRAQQFSISLPFTLAGGMTQFAHLNSTLAQPMAELEDSVRRYIMKRHTNVLSVTFPQWSVEPIGGVSAPSHEYLLAQPPWDSVSYYPASENESTRIHP